jgi:hypothetical protein
MMTNLCPSLSTYITDDGFHKHITFGTVILFPDFDSGDLLSQFISQSYGLCHCELKSI